MKVDNATWPRISAPVNESRQTDSTLTADASEESATIAEKFPALFCRKFTILQI